jgi:hypothetical protein
MGNCSACLTPADCGNDTPCGTRTCNNATCGWSYTPAGTIDNGTAGDCQLLSCSGSSEVPTPVAGDDPIVDGNPCTDDLCNGTVPSNPNSMAGATCDDGGSPGNGECDGAGTCRDCVTAAGCSSGQACFNQACCTPIPQSTACAGKQCGTEPQGCGLPDHSCGTCPVATPACTAAETCVECVTDADCANHPDGSDCNPQTNQCRCGSNAHCQNSPAGPECLLGRCGCNGGGDCNVTQHWGDSCLGSDVCGCSGNGDCAPGQTCVTQKCQ